MGKLKQLMIEVEQAIADTVQDGWDEAVDTIHQARTDTHSMAMDAVEMILDRHELTFDDLDLLLETEGDDLYSRIDTTLDYIWDM